VPPLSSIIILIHVPCIFHYFVLWRTNLQLFHKLSHSYMFRHCRFILWELVINTLPSYTGISNAAVGNTIYNVKHLKCKLYYQQLNLKYLCNLARYWLKARWGWHDSVETCSSVIICAIIVDLLVIVRNNKMSSVSLLRVYGQFGQLQGVSISKIRRR